MPLLALLALLALPASSQERKPFEVNLSQFCGIDESQSTTLIDDCHSPDAENVITDEGGLRRFPGMDVMVSSALAGFPIRNIWQFIAPSGTKYVVFHSSSGIYYTDLSASPTLLNTVDSGSEVDAVQAFGKMVFVNRTQAGWYWDGTSTAAISGMPKASFIEFKDERIYLADTETSASQVAVSSFGSLSYWTVPVDLLNQPEAPNSFTFQKDDGCSIRCLKSTPWGVFVGKECSSHILKGFDNETYYKRIIHPQVGCMDDRSVQVDDRGAIWLAKDGVYIWNGSDIPKMASRKIENRIRSIRQAVAGNDSWSVSSEGEWAAGLAFANGPTASWSTSYEPGSIVPSSWTAVEGSTFDFNGTGVNVSTAVSALVLDSNNSALSIGMVMPSSQTFSVPNGDFSSAGTWNYRAQGTATSARETSSCQSPITAPCAKLTANASGTTYTGYEIIDANTGVVIGGNRVTTDCSGVITAPFADNLNLPATTGTGYGVNLTSPTVTVRFFLEDGSNRASVESSTISAALQLRFSCARDLTLNPREMYVDTVKVTTFPISATYTSETFDTGFSTPIISVDISSGYIGSSAYNNDSQYLKQVGTVYGSSLTLRYQTSSDGSSWGTPVVFSPASAVTGTNRYFRYIADFSNAVGTSTVYVDTITFTVLSTGPYYSNVQYIGTAITSWRTGDFETTGVPSGRVTFSYRTANSPFTVLSATPAWSGHTNHQTIATPSTGTYVQFRITSALTSSTETLSIQAADTNWREGDAPPAASLVHEHRYFLCVNVTSSSASNDTCEVLQRNNEWTRMTGKSIGAMTIFDFDPVAGSGDSDSTIWRIMRRGTYNFGGSAINSYWKTKDFSLDHVSYDKTLREIWLDAEREPGASVDIGYSVDRATATVSETVALDTQASYVNERVPFDMGFARGRYLRFKIFNTDLDEFFKVNVLSFFGDVEPRY